MTSVGRTFVFCQKKNTAKNPYKFSITYGPNTKFGQTGGHACRLTVVCHINVSSSFNFQKIYIPIFLCKIPKEIIHNSVYELPQKQNEISLKTNCYGGNK